MITSGKFVIWLIAFLVACAANPACTYADTDGTEIQISDQPEHLTLQLGPQWAGVEFQLRTDEGIFPVPVVVNQSGILQMDLGGSKTYILSCLSSAVTVSKPEQSIDTPTPSVPPPTPPGENTGELVVAKASMPAGFLILFVIAFTAAVGGLIELWYYLRRKRTANHKDENDFE